MLATHQFLVNRIAARNMIGYWHDNVVCLMGTLCTVAKRYSL